MSYLAQFKSNFDANEAQFVSDFYDDSISITVNVLVENGNMSAGSVVITNGTSITPTIEIDRRSGAGSAWRHFMFAVENASGRTPTFKVNRATKDGSPISSGWKPVYTTDFITWVQADSVVLTGSTSGTIDFTFPGTLPNGSVYIASHRTARQSDVENHANFLLTNYPSWITVSDSADVNGVYTITPAENDDIGRSVGGNNQYALTVRFGGATTDGFRKRKLVMFNGIHAAGEGQSWETFKYAIDWMLTSASAEAANFRSNWDVFLYFLVNPNGVRGGNSRTTFRSATDPNRDWKLTGSSILQEITDLRAAIELDTQGHADLLYSWHGDVYSTSNFMCWVDPADFSAGTRTPAAQAIFNEGAVLFGTSVEISSSGTNNTDVWWGKAKVGCKTAIDCEVAAMKSTDVSWYQTLGQNWLLMAVEADSQNLFVTSELEPQLFVNDNVFLGHALSQGDGQEILTPSLFSNNTEFYAASIQPGAVNLTPSLFTNTNVFYAHAVSQDGQQILQTGLFLNTNSFYAHFVQPGIVSIQPGLFSNQNTFYPSNIIDGSALRPSLFVNANQFYAATITVGAVTLTPALFTNTNIFYTHSVGGQDRIKWGSSIKLSMYNTPITIQ